jgi:hypothetical protein
MKVRPFALQSADQFRPPPPPPPDSTAFASEIQEVRDLGGRVSTRRSSEQTQIAHFWSDFSYTSSPPGHWNDIVRNLAPVGRRMRDNKNQRFENTP